MALSTEDNLRSLERTTGIDFVGLREKYKNQAHNSVSISTSCETNCNNTDITMAVTASTASNVAMESLEQYGICKACNGLGIVTYFYNHQKRERTCDTCDGDCIITETC